MLKFSQWLEEKKKKSSKESTHQTTATSSPLRGQNQDQSGYSPTKNVADYTISDGYIPGQSGIRGPQVQMSKGSQTTDVSGKNTPHSAGHLQKAADRRRLQLDKLAQQQRTQQEKERERQQSSREKEGKTRDKINKLRSKQVSGV